ncbi:uncharacterized protein LOC109843891 isoform X1 [Asparagus officinalis]|uniref:uncharacterized protein LOC109843891 isoform X1 n=1 Tax=Asparagus officinalis TaxID=4686 RepID=UPI00098E1EFC|nr:uncharacterized protein LOC109843891 isoform X1 [Asparagus officinalis]
MAPTGFKGLCNFQDSRNQYAITEYLRDSILKKNVGMTLITSVFVPWPKKILSIHQVLIFSSTGGLHQTKGGTRSFMYLIVALGANNNPIDRDFRQAERVQNHRITDFVNSFVRFIPLNIFFPLS